jgi:hypothetical protein
VEQTRAIPIQHFSNLSFSMHLAARLQFERVAREFAQWRAVPKDQRSPAPAWWWQPAFEALEQHEVMSPLWCQRLELPVPSTYAAAAAMLLATLSDQTSFPWPDEFPRRILRNDEGQCQNKSAAGGERL